MNEVKKCEHLVKNMQHIIKHVVYDNETDVRHSFQVILCAMFSCFSWICLHEFLVSLRASRLS